MGRTDELGAESRGQTFRFDPEKLVLITDPKHKLYQQTAVDAPPQWMIDSAFHYGIKVPITLRKGAKHRGKYKMEVIVGRRRVLALRAANKLRKAKGLKPWTIRAVVDILTDEEALELIQIENHHRAAPGILDDAIAARNALAEGATEQKVCNDMRWTRAQLDQHLALIECHRQVQDAVMAGHIALAAVVDLRKLEKDEQPAALLKLAEAAAVGPRQVRRKLEATNPENMEDTAKVPRRSKVQIRKLRERIGELSFSATGADRRYMDGVLDTIRWFTAGGAEPKV